MSTGAEVPGTTPRSGAAQRTERSGRHRSWRSGPARRSADHRAAGRLGAGSPDIRRAAAARLAATLLGVTLVLTGCTAIGQEAGQTAPDPTTDTPSAATQDAADDAALGEACTAFWGDPDYEDPLSRIVLDRAGTAPGAGPSDPFFYSMTGDDIETVFESAPEPAQQTAGALAEWFRTEPERGTEADRKAFRTAWEGVAGSCQEHSVAASWAVAPGEDGTKPAALVCTDVFDTPGTLTHFANANVLTSNMFKLVGLSPRAVPADREEDVAATAELLSAEIAAVDDDAVRAALEQVRAPFQAALDGETWSEGLREPLTELGSACEAVGHSSSAPGEIENDAVVGASAGTESGIYHGGRS